MTMKTYTPKAKDITRNWHLIDAKDEVLGRLSTKTASLLMGKHKPTFSSHLDCGDYVVIVNAGQIQVTGNKLKQKVYYRHSNFPGGLKSKVLKDRLTSEPTKVIADAVKGMLPKNKLQSGRLQRLKVFSGETHPYVNKFNKDTNSLSESVK